jgi:hypothetical protein
MSRAPYVITALFTICGATWAIQLGVAPAPFAPGAGAVLALGLVIFVVIAAAGLLLSRGRWAPPLAAIVTVAAMGLAVVIEDLTAWAVIGLVAGALTLAGLAGPWLKGWIRERPSAQGPGPKAMGVVFGALTLVPAVALASPSGLEPAHGILGGAGLLLAWGYARARLWALWGIRLVLPVLALPALYVSPWPGKVLLAVVVGITVGLSWTREAFFAVAPLMSRLPGPRVAVPRPDKDTSA